MTAIIGRMFVLPAVLGQPERPTEHCRNALMLLAGLQATATYLLPEIGRARRRIHAAVVVLEHGGPARCAARHISGAIEALRDVPCDWDVVPELRDACARLFRALFMLGGAP